ncbi:MAG: NAD(P)H-hydrate dehydratase [Eubacteriales bacterium]|nr:NAD(P)H-hydrate dehydratase [Eubacteriales bacterium]
MIHSLTRDDIEPLLPKRPSYSHKGINGHALLCIGSDKYIGAAVLCAKAALRCGCGKTTVVTTMDARTTLLNIPEIITVSTNTTSWNTSACKIAVLLLAKKQAVAIGSGMGDGDISLLLEAALVSKIPLVIDADGLNHIAKHPQMLNLLHDRVVLTPHIGEMARLCGLNTSEIMENQAEVAKKYAKLWNCVLLLKSSHSYISDGERIVENTTGNAGLAKGGSGDVLCGIVTAMLCQGLAPFEAACAGAYLLGASADEAVKMLDNRLLVASDLFDVINTVL